MNILMVGGCFPDGNDGATSLMKAYAKGFIKLGHSVVVYSHAKQKEKSYLHGFMNGFEYVCTSNSKRFFWSLPLLRSLYSVPLVSKNVWDRKRTRGIHVIIMYQSPLYYQGLLFYLLGRILNIPVVYIFADYYDNIHEKTTCPKLRVRLNVRLGVSVLPRISDLVIVLSKYLYDRLSKYISPNRLLRITSIVDIDRFRADLSSHPLVGPNSFGGRTKIVYLGSFLPHQNVEGLIKAAKLLESRRQQIVFIIAGCIPKKQMLVCQRLAMDLSLDDFVVFTGCIPPEQVPRFLAGADILVSPRDNSLSSIAAGPMKIAEYLISGKPIISTRVGDIVNLAVDRKDLLFCEPNNPESLASAIVEVLSNRSLAMQLAQCGRELAIRSFSNLKLCQTMIVAFSKLKNNRKGAY